MKSILFLLFFLCLLIASLLVSSTSSSSSSNKQLWYELQRPNLLADLTRRETENKIDKWIIIHDRDTMTYKSRMKAKSPLSRWQLTTVNQIVQWRSLIRLRTHIDVRVIMRDRSANKRLAERREKRWRWE